MQTKKTPTAERHAKTKISLEACTALARSHVRELAIVCDLGSLWLSSRQLIRRKINSLPHKYIRYDVSPCSDATRNTGH